LGKGFWLRIAYLYYQSPSGLNFSNNMHKKIVEAFKKKDARSVQKLVEAHIEHAMRQLLLSFNQIAKPSIGKQLYPREIK
jgi:DNA-binding GntR family transcriptional regulator